MTKRRFELLSLVRKRCDSRGSSESFLARDEVRVNGDVLILEEENTYFDGVSKKKILYLKIYPQEEIIKLEGLTSELKSTDTAREFEKLKRDIIAKSEERRGEEPIFGGKNLEGLDQPRTKRSQE